MLKRVIFIMFFNFTLLFSMNKAMINVSNVDVELGASFDIGQFQEDYAIDTYFAGISFLGSSSSSGKGGSLFSGNFLVINDLPNYENVRLGIGIKAVATTFDNQTFLAIPFGTVLDYNISNEDPLYWKSSLFYAPGALSLRDARSYFEFRTGIHFEAIENVRIFLEFRSIKTNYKASGGRTFNESVYGGIEIGF